MTRQLIAPVLTAVLITVAAPAHAGEVVVSATDAKNDVTLLSDSGGLTTAERQSIDLRKLQIEKRSGKTRFTIKLKRITSSSDFEQMVFITLKAPAGADPAYRTDIGISAQSRELAYAYYSPDASGENQTICDPLTAKVRPAKRVIVLDVPNQCIPEQPSKVRLVSATGFFRSEGVGYSRDKMKVAGTYELT